MYYSKSASVSLGFGNSVRYISYLNHFLTLCLLFFLMYLTHAGLQVAQTNLSHFPLSTRRYLHVKPHHLVPSPNLQEKRQLKGRQRQQGKRRRRKFPCHMIARQWNRSKTTPQKDSPASQTRSKRKLPLPDLNC